MASDNFPRLAGTPNNEQSFYWYLELQHTLPFKFVSSRFSFFAGQLEPVGWSSQQSKALEIEMTCLKKQNIKGSRLKPDFKEAQYSAKALWCDCDVVLLLLATTSDDLISISGFMALSSHHDLR